MRRMAARASWSAEDVTVQVLSTTRSASSGCTDRCRPAFSRSRSIAAPSACVARQPKFWTWKRCIGIKVWLAATAGGVLQVKSTISSVIENRAVGAHTHLRNLGGSYRGDTSGAGGGGATLLET